MNTSVERIVRAWALAIVGILAFGPLSPGHAVSPKTATGAPVKAVFAEGRLWVVSDKGVLTSFSETDAAPRVEIADSVLRLCLRDGAPLVALGEYERGREWRLRRHAAGGWTDFAVVRGGGVYLNGMDCSQDSVALVSAKSVVRVKNGDQHFTRFEFERGAVEAGESTTAVMDTPAALYVGYDEGLIGGMFRAAPTGHATPVAERGAGRCRGPLAGRCDPVQAIAPSPKEGCIAVAVGQANAPAAGRVLEVCGETVRQIYAKPAGGEVSVPFFDIARSGPSLWVSGADGLSRLTGERVEFVGVPPMKTIGDYRVSFALPGVVAIQAREGGMILLAPR